MTLVCGESDDPSMDMFDSTHLHYLIRLGVAAAVGGLVGLERESKGKPAGMRTNVLMCMGSCLLMILSIEVASKWGFPADPGRIAAQVVTGIGFLGAGTIIRSRVSVTGLTTAATLWFVAAIGMVVGNGSYLLAGVATILVLVTLTGLARVEYALEVTRQLHILRLRVPSSGSAIAQIRSKLREARITPDDLQLSRDEEGVSMDLEYICRDAKHYSLISQLREVEDVEIVLYY